MPPVNQGNKAALITWTVVATVFGVTMAVLALIAYVGRNDLQTTYDRRTTEFSEFASDADMQSARMTELRQQARDEGRGNVYNLLALREEMLARQATGATRFEQAQQTIDATLRRLNETQNVNATTLTGALDQMQSEMANLQRQNQSLRQNQEDLEARLARAANDRQQVEQTLNQQIAQLNEQLEDLQALQDEMMQRTLALEQGSQESLTNLQTEWEGRLREAEERYTRVNRALETAQQNVNVLTQQNRARFRGDQMMAAPDGRVLRAPSQGRLFINVGRNQGVTNGMTFQVYDQLRGIPRVTDANAAELPTGKGSIEVISVDGNSSEARVVNLQPGQTIQQGDLIANLAYDRNMPVRFRIYGDFDLNNDGNPDPADRDRMMTLVREFGGRIVDQVTVETDVLVIGKEPELPRMTEADYSDPLKVREYNDAQRRLEDYMTVRSQAQQLNIPILNQNQFLYYIGYFDQVRR